MLSQAILQSTLGHHPFVYHDSVDSTNDLAMNWLKEGASQGAVVIADEQRRGRGRLGRAWHTPKGVALALSVVLKPPTAFVGRVSVLGALCVAETCEQLGILGVGIKWPNDVQINGRKVCGILPEAVWQDGILQGVVLGMGLNVRVVFDDTLAQTAISLEDVTATPVNRAEVTAMLINRLMFWAERIGNDALFEAWKTRLNTLGQRVRVNDLEGVAIGVDGDGALLLETANGQERVIAGDIYME